MSALSVSFDQLVDLLLELGHLALQDGLLILRLLLLLLGFLQLHPERDQLVLQIIHLLILLVKILFEDLGLTPQAICWRVLAALDA